MKKSWYEYHEFLTMAISDIDKDLYLCVLNTCVWWSFPAFQWSHNISYLGIQGHRSERDYTIMFCSIDRSGFLPLVQNEISCSRASFVG